MDDRRMALELWFAAANECAGFTVDRFNESLPRTGYFVGGQSWTLIRAAELLTPEDVDQYVSTHPNTRYFGMWVDDHKVYVDSVDHISDHDKAHAVASERHELAVFNITTGECERS